ncbi:MAG: hypothetical protein ACLFPS_01965 [Clostridia bacterium]
MSKYYFFNFLLLSIAFLSLVRISVNDIYSIYKEKNRKALRIILARLGGVKSNKVNKFSINTENMLNIMGIDISLSEYISILFILSVLAAFLGVLIDNLLLALLLFISTNFLLHQYLKNKYYKKSREIQKDLNLGLSLITNSYLESNNLIRAIKSNIYKMPESVKEVFSDFLVQVEMVDPDIKKGVLRLKNKFNDEYFIRWCDLAIHCINDRDYIKVLPAVVNEMAIERENQSKHDSLVNEVYKENLQLLIITALTPFILKIIFPEMLVYLLNTAVGKIIIAVSYFLLAITLGKILTINKPININKEKNE